MSNALRTNPEAARRGAILPMRLMSHESVSEYEDLFDAISKVCAPQDRYDQFCVQLLAGCAWRLRRLRNAPPRLAAIIAGDAVSVPKSLNILLRSRFGRRKARIAEVRDAINAAVLAPFVQNDEPRPERPYPVAYTPLPVRRRTESTSKSAA